MGIRVIIILHVNRLGAVTLSRSFLGRAAVEAPAAREAVDQSVCENREHIKKTKKHVLRSSEMTGPELAALAWCGLVLRG